MWSPKPSDIITAEQRAAEAAETALSVLRSDRSKRLSATDWVVLRSLETGEPVPQAWLDYRQALRDLPGNTDDPLNPEWPKEPDK